tara:strand:- start:218 stop:358 length:141 start_codon:yes stop_codon:yes gene_type:complete
MTPLLRENSEEEQKVKYETSFIAVLLVALDYLLHPSRKRGERWPYM